MKKINIGILGYGTIGSAVDHLIEENHDLILSRTGLDLCVVKVCDLSPKVKHKLLRRDAYNILEDETIDVIVEAIGGEKKPLEFILSAIKNGKHVVTSNKEVIALHGARILHEASRKGVSVRFEAAVGGGIPIISPLSHDLLSNEITEIYGIVNGTTNYILSKMTEEGSEFKETLEEAQASASSIERRLAEIRDKEISS